MRGTFEPGQSPFRIKGLVYRQLFLTIERDVDGGREGLLAAIEDPALRRFAAQPFLAASWYDNMPIVPLNELSARLVGQDNTKYLEARAIDQAEEDLSGVYSWLLKLASPRLVAKGLERLTPRYFDWGETRTREISPTHIEATRTAVPDPLVAWCDTVNRPFMRYAFQETGAQDVRVELTKTESAGTAHGMPVRDLTYSLRWR
ncbi:MAG: hypothetical protein AB8I08_12335 [Sandaracinaceae bacterium]